MGDGKRALRLSSHGLEPFPAFFNAWPTWQALGHREGGKIPILCLNSPITAFFLLMSHLEAHLYTTFVHAYLYTYVMYTLPSLSSSKGSQAQILGSCVPVASCSLSDFSGLVLAIPGPPILSSSCS